jgi:hypothetical protein
MFQMDDTASDWKWQNSAKGLLPDAMLNMIEGYLKNVCKWCAKPYYDADAKECAYWHVHTGFHWNLNGLFTRFSTPCESIHVKPRLIEPENVFTYV